MDEKKYCFACHHCKDKEIEMVFEPSKGPYGTYTCPVCGREVKKAGTEDLSEKYPRITPAQPTV